MVPGLDVKFHEQSEFCGYFSGKFGEVKLKGTRPVTPPEHAITKQKIQVHVNFYGSENYCAYFKMNAKLDRMPT